MISAEWVSVIVGAIGLIAIIPIISKWLKDRKISREARKMLEVERYRDNVKPCFELYDTNDFQGKMIMLKNTGSKAFKLVLVAIGTQISPNLIPDKYDVDKGSVVKIFLGDHFRILPGETNQVHIGYEDIDGRRYQQTYSKKGMSVNITSPMLLT